VHAVAEGVAVGALLGAQPRRVAGWLAGSHERQPDPWPVAAGAFPLAQATEPVLLALAAGVIAEAAWASLRAALHSVHTRRRGLSHTAATVAIAAIVTALAVNTAG
jgi:ZIP family zinc transporter